MLARGPKPPGSHVHVVTLKKPVPSAICLEGGRKKEKINMEGLRDIIGGVLRLWG